MFREISIYLAVVLAAFLAPRISFAQLGTSLGGDLRGPTSGATVTGIQGRPVGPAAPSPGQALIWDGDSYEPDDVGGGGGSGDTWTSTLNTSISITGLSATVTPTALTWTIPAEKASEGHRLRWLLSGTHNTTTTLAVTFFPYIDGRKLQQNDLNMNLTTSNRCWVITGQIHILEDNAGAGLMTMGGMSRSIVGSCGIFFSAEPIWCWNVQSGMGPPDVSKLFEIGVRGGVGNPSEELIIERCVYWYEEGAP